MTQDGLTLDELRGLLWDEYVTEHDLYRKGLMAMHLLDFERGDRSEKLRARMQRLLAHRRSER
jgi:hypothetical protein